MSNLPKPSVIQLSQWELEYYSIRSPTMDKETYIKQRTKDWYRYQYYKQFNK